MNDPAALVDGIVYVLLPVHDRRAITEGFVTSLIAQTDTRYQLILIDDGSTDGTADMVRSRVPNVVVLHGEGDWWWAGSLEQGRRWLRDHTPGDCRDLVLIANDDTSFDPDFIAAGRAALRSRPRTLVLAQLYDQDTGELLESGVHVDWRTLEFRPVGDKGDINCLSTRGLMLRLTDFLSIRGLHPRVLPHYLSDYAFTIHAARTGFGLEVDPSFRLWVNQQTTGERTVPRGSRRQVLGQLLSRRSVHNPVTMSVFLMLSCPKRHLARNLCRVWRNAVRTIWDAGRTEKAG
jgi:GT2 family glycosyltransferase